MALRTSGPRPDTARLYPKIMHVAVKMETHQRYLDEAKLRHVSLSTVIREHLEAGDDALARKRLGAL